MKSSLVGGHENGVAPGIRRVLSGCLGGESFGCRDYRIVELSNWSL